MADEFFPTGAMELAVAGAAISVVFKVVNDRLEVKRKRRSTAAALAGEIKAYLGDVDPSTMLTRLRAHVDEDRTTRQEWLRTLPTLPAGHPVFDKVVDQIGTLKPRVAQRVSETYNVVSGIRSLMAGLAIPALAEASDELQRARIMVLADMLDRELLRFPEVIGMLEKAARPWWRRWLRDAWE